MKQGEDQEVSQKVRTEDKKENEAESTKRIVKDGILLCSNCKVYFSIFEYVPVLLVFQTRFHDQFAKNYGYQLIGFSDYTMVNEPPQPGELSVQETCTDEWSCMDGRNDALSFLYSEEDLVSINKEVWLKWNQSPRQVKNVLEIGCGLGAESKAIKAATMSSEVFAVDLNFALLKVGESFKGEPGIHLIIASIFRLPFKKESFDLVYSQGVIHHTFSTLEAFKSIASYGGYGRYMFIWVYGLEDHLVRGGAVGFVTRVNWLIEKTLRPVISRMPKMSRDLVFIVMTLACHALIKSRVKLKDKWKLKNTNHDLRDWLSPRFAHRHSYNELFEWFEELGFCVIDVQSPSAFRRIMEKRLWGVGMTGERFKVKNLKHSTKKNFPTDVIEDHSRVC